MLTTLRAPYAVRIGLLAPSYDPRHIEAFMRVEHSTLDSLSAAVFRREVSLAAECVDLGGLETAEKLARSFGL